MRYSGSPQFIKEGIKNNTNLASIHFLKDVIAILLIYLYRNYTTGGSCLDNERELGEEICFHPCSCKERGWRFYVETAPIQLTCCVSRFMFHGSTVISVYVNKCFLYTNYF